MEETDITEKLKKALNSYNSYDGKSLNQVFLYMNKAKTFLKKEKDINHPTKKLECLISDCITKIVKNNRGLVEKIAREYANKVRRESCYNDFFQEGIIGLLKAIPKYDPKKGEFGNYVAVAIRQNIQRKINEIIGNVRLPVNFPLYLNEIRTLSEMFKEKYKRTPNDKELAEFSGKTIKRIKHLRTIDLLRKTDSIDAEIGKDEKEKKCAIDYYVNPLETPLEEECIQRIISENVIKYIDKIPNKEDRGVLIERLRGRTLEEIGKEKGITRERVRQREKRAIKNARKMREFSRLRDS